MTKGVDYIVREVKTAFLADFTCCVCKKTKLASIGKLWDIGNGEYEFICNACEQEILEDAGYD